MAQKEDLKMAKKKRMGVGPFTVIIIVSILGTGGFYAGCWAQRYFNISSEKIIGIHNGTNDGKSHEVVVPLNNSPDIIIKH